MPILLPLLLLQAAMPGMKTEPPIHCAGVALLPERLKSFYGKAPAPNVGTGFDLAAGDPAPAVVKPSRPGGVAVGGFNVATAGRYEILLGDPGWIDLAGADGKPLASVAHRHGDACTGVGKIVTFALAPGSYTLQVSELKQPSIHVLIVPAA